MDTLSSLSTVETESGAKESPLKGIGNRELNIGRLKIETCIFDTIVESALTFLMFAFIKFIIFCCCCDLFYS